MFFPRYQCHPQYFNGVRFSFSLPNEILIFYSELSLIKWGSLNIFTTFMVSIYSDFQFSTAWSEGDLFPYLYQISKMSPFLSRLKIVVQRAFGGVTEEWHASLSSSFCVHVWLTFSCHLVLIPMTFPQRLCVLSAMSYCVIFNHMILLWF